MFDVFGSQLSQPVKFVIAFVVVLALIGLTAWLVRRFGASRLGGSTRGRQPRLAVIEANIVRAVPARKPLPARVPAPEAAARPAAADNAWPLQPLTETPPVAPAVPASRPLRAGAGDEPWLPPEPGARPRPADNLGHLSVDLAGKRPAPASGAPRIEPVPAAPASAAQADQNLAEMAQQLEAALRRGAAASARAQAARRAALRPASRPQDRAESGEQARAEARREGGACRRAEIGAETRNRQGTARQSGRGDGQLARPSAWKIVTGRSGRRVRPWAVAAGVAGLTVALAGAAGAQEISVNFPQGSGLTERVIQLIALLTVLSLAPSILVMMTSFTRIVVVLSLLRTALGTATAPPNAVIISLALFLTAFVMGPALQKAYDAGVRPLVANEITAEQAFERGSQPLRAFMEKNVREKDLKLFVDMAHEAAPAKPEDLSLRVLIPAFMISELKRAFEIGFLLFLPFLIIDLVVASVLMSMGMMMLPPVVVSLPFKLIFFVLVDGWSLVAGSLIQSYGS